MSFGMLAMSGGPGRGLNPGAIDGVMKATEAIGSRTLVVVDRDDANSKSLTYDPGDGSIFQAVRVPASGDEFAGVFGIADAAIAEDAEGKVVFSGVVTGVDVETGTAAGDLLMVTTSGELAIANGAVLGKVVGIALTAISGGTATVWFDGITGFGTYEG